MADNTKLNMQIEGLKKKCRYCGEIFTTMEQRKKYCSAKCKTKFHRNKLVT